MPPTASRLDWLSFTMDVNPFMTEGVAVLGAKDLAEQFNNAMGDYIAIDTPSVGRGRYPYRFSSDGDGFRVYWSPGQPEVLVEISGEGCERLHNAGTLKSVVNLALERLTRADIATDIQTKTDPTEFVENRTNRRHKSRETARTTTGTTEYIGSRKSDRYCRVYRYASPHPRSDYLRVECVFRGPQAVALARTWLEHGDDETAARAGNQYGWSHPDWEPHSKEKITAWRPDRKTHRRYLWYKTQVVPALRGLVVGGHLQPAELIQDVLGPSQGQMRAILEILTRGSVNDAKSE